MPAKPRSKPKRAAKAPPLLTAQQVRSSLAQKSASMAPADIEELVARRVEILERAAEVESTHPMLVRQTELALRLLGDHVTGVSPQIPYYTVSLLGTALFYFLDQDDAIPDWIPNIGTADDALVLQLAFEMGAAGITRYCDAMGLSTEGLLPARDAHR
jgi:uncharacterized membrane protein YkvA (DUF1232 family)